MGNGAPDAVGFVIDAEDTDRWALDHGYVSITPTQIDITAYDAFDELKILEK